MTREDGLAELAKRASNSNLYFSFSCGNPYIETIGEEGELVELAKIFGGSIERFCRARKYMGKSCLRIRNNDALTVAKELMERIDFRKSGKYHYASDMVYESN